MKDGGNLILDRYFATLSADMSIKCDNKNPTANGRTMKSGYGINETVTASVSTNQSTAITYLQNAVSYFQNFDMKPIGGYLKDTRWFITEI